MQTQIYLTPKGNDDGTGLRASAHYDNPIGS